MPAHNIIDNRREKQVDRINGSSKNEWNNHANAWYKHAI